MTNPKSFRPSNGTEGDIFMGQWCAHCAFNELDEDACDIQLAALGNGTDDCDYPSEWIYKDGQPACTAFCARSENGEEITRRCQLTPDMFAELA